MKTVVESSFAHRLIQSLPKGVRFYIHHLSSPPILCPALFSAPPNQQAEITYCESHLLSISIARIEQPCQVFAIEVLIYTTENLTTLFVSKADSTGYLHLLNLSHGTPSALRSSVSIFLSYLVEQRQRPGIRLVLSLFARAQDQYLFPGSIENSGKHVLDDRELIKWWCKVLDAVLREYPVQSDQREQGAREFEERGNRARSRGYLKVPGCDTYETKTFFPKAVKRDDGEDPRWKPQDPLLALGKAPSVPERCLIPRFPDDPKARFVMDLDDEIPDTSSEVQESLSKPLNTGRWRSVRSLEQFWEMMSFRQECAAGRLVGFIWGVFTPPRLLRRAYDSVTSQPDRGDSTTPLPTPLQSHVRDEVIHSPGPPLRPNRASDLPPSPLSSSHLQSLESLIAEPAIAGKDRLLDNVVSLAQTFKPRSVLSRSEQPEISRYYLWPHSSRGEVVLPEASYKKAIDLLLSLDYADEQLAIASTNSWIVFVSSLAGVQVWGQDVVGTKELNVRNGLDYNPEVAVIDGVAGKKRAREGVDGTDLQQTCQSTNGVNVLALGIVRKKPKITRVA